MKKLLLLSAFLWAVSLSPIQAKNFEMQILHASDGESGIEAIENAPNFAALVDKFDDQYPNTVILSSGDNYLVGPFLYSSKEKQVIKTIKAVYKELYKDVDPKVFDHLRSGSARADIAIANIIGLDASVLGNHEMDLGPEFFGSLIKGRVKRGKLYWMGTTFPYLTSNIDFSKDKTTGSVFTNEILVNTAFKPDLQDLKKFGRTPRLAPSTIIERSGEKIGVVGVTTPLLAMISLPGNLEIKEPGAHTNDMKKLAKVLQPEIDRLTAKGVNKIVLVSHLQLFDLEQSLAPQLKNVDVIIAGGSDFRLFDNEDLSRTNHAGDAKQGHYPYFTKDANGKPVCVVSTDGNYKYLGRLVISFDEDGVILPNSVDENVSGAFATTKETVEKVYQGQNPFPEGSKGALVKRIVSSIAQAIRDKDGLIVGNTSVFLEGRRDFIRTRETNLGHLLTNSDLWYAKTIDPTVQVAIRNGGGIRNPIGEIVEISRNKFVKQPPQKNKMSGKKKGQISRLDLETVLSFNNNLSIFTLTSGQLLEVLEHTVYYIEPGRTPGTFGHFAGLKVIYDSSQKPGSRVRDVFLINENGSDTKIVDNGSLTKYAPARIRVVTLDYLAEHGGDGYPFPKFIEANKDFANYMNLSKSQPKVNKMTFAKSGSEQDAFSEYLFKNYNKKPYKKKEQDLEKRMIDLAQ